jgi:hypothetical protein
MAVPDGRALARDGHREDEQRYCDVERTRNTGEFEMQRWRRLVAGGIGAALTCGLLLSTSASAAATPSTGTFTGGGSWEGTVTLPTYPCNSISCGGNFAGLFAGSVSGVDTLGNPYSITWPDPTAPLPSTNLTAAFDYNEMCPASQTGTAGGSFTVSGGLVRDPALSGGQAHDGTVTGSFSWIRGGLVVVVILSAAQTTGGGVVLATPLLPEASGAGVGAFVPEGTNTCATVQSVSAAVVGASGFVG